MDRRRKHWGWGYEDQQPPADQFEAAAKTLCEQLGYGLEQVEQPVALAQLGLADPSVPIPTRLSAFSAADTHARASHALGKSYVDVVRGFRGRFEHPPDFVCRPRDEIELEAVLEWCSAEGVAAIPFGGGTSVVGGVTPDVGERYNGAVSVDLGELDHVLEVDEVSSAALIEAGATGPRLEDQLRERDLTLRHFPQSFEYSTLGGWIATRAGGHFATLWTHIEDLVESVRAITPSGVWESRRLPGSGAGISPDRMLAGSEGTLAVITRAWVRVQRRPAAPQLAGGPFRELRRRRGGRACDLPGGSASSQLPAAGRRRDGPDDAPGGLAIRCSCWASSPSTTRSRSRWSERWRCAPSTVGGSPARTRATERPPVVEPIP